MLRLRPIRRKSAKVLKLLPQEKIAPIRKQKNERQKRREISVMRKLIIGITVILLALLITAAVLFVISLNSSGSFHWAWLDEFLGRDSQSEEPSEVSTEPSVLSAIELPEEDDGSDLLIIVNSLNPLPSEYSPELAAVAGIRMEARAAADLEAMLEAAQSANVSLRLLRGYTTAEQQEKIYNEKYEELLFAGTSPAKAKDTASIYKPGWSEAQTGFLLELNCGADFEESSEYFWLCEHSAEYGFVFRFPEGKMRKTGVAFTPSVLRYVGAESAAAMRRLDMCLEEYVRYLSQR